MLSSEIEIRAFINHFKLSRVLTVLEMSPCQSISLTSFSYCDVESLIALLLRWSISGYIVAVLSWWILPFLLFFDEWLRSAHTSSWYGAGF